MSASTAVIVLLCALALHVASRLLRACHGERRRRLLWALESGPGTAADLIERVKIQTAGELVLDPQSVYPILRDLERRGTLVSFDGEPLACRGGRPRRVYRLRGGAHRDATRGGA